MGLNPYLLQAAFRYEAQILHKALLLEPNRSLVADKLRCLNTVLDRGVFVDSAVLRLIWPADFQDIKIYLIADLGNGLEQLECFTSNAPVAVYKEVFLHLCGGHFTMLKPSSTEEGTKVL